MIKLVVTIALTLFFSVFSSAGVTEDYIRQNALLLDSNNFQSILSTISTFKIVTIGEMHGSKEAPQFAYDLFQNLRLAGKKVILGLEVPEEDQFLIDSFVRTKERSLLKKSRFFLRGFQDGRSSEAMVKLLEDLPKDAIVICFDSPNVLSGQERDQKMAMNLIKAYTRYKSDSFVILAGDVHSAIEVGASFDPAYQPMGFLLHTLPESPIGRGDIRAIRVRYTGGNIWACMGSTEADCHIHQMFTPPNPYSTAVSFNKYFLVEPLHEGYNSTLFFRELTASRPAFK